MTQTTARGIVTGPQPSDKAIRFRARLRFYVALTRAAHGFDASDLLTLVVFGLLAAGIVIVAGPGWACIFVALLLSLMTPVGTALRVFIRGR